MISSRHLLKSCSAALCCSSLATSYAAAADSGPLQPAEPQPLNRFSVGYRVGFNISATFKGAGGGYGLTPGPNAYRPGEYDDGYVRPDSTGGGGLTWNWGYMNSSQIAGDSMILSRNQRGAAGDTHSCDGNPQHGFEIMYQRQLSKPGKLQFGLECAFNWTDVTLHDGQTVPGKVTRLSDTYSLGGIVPPQDPPPAWAYKGTFFGPGPVIDDFPIAQSTATVPNVYTTGSRDIEAFMYGFRLGPYVELPISRRFACTLSGGLAFAVVDSEFRVSETTRGTGFGPVTTTLRDWDGDVVVGGFVSGNLKFALSRAFDVFGGIQFQALGNYEHKIGNGSVVVDLGESLFGVVGIGYSF
jgi:hypothetical protein